MFIRTNIVQHVVEQSIVFHENVISSYIPDIQMIVVHLSIVSL